MRSPPTTPHIRAYTRPGGKEHVYSRGEDAALRNAVRNSKTIGDFWVEAPGLQQRWDTIAQMAAAERVLDGPAIIAAPEVTVAVAQTVLDAQVTEATVRRGAMACLPPGSDDWYHAKAYNQVRLYVRTIAEPELAASLRTAIMDSNIKDVNGVHNQKCFAIIFDASMHGEAGSNAMYRHPPLTESRVKKLIGSVLAARSNCVDTCVPDDGDVYMIFDGGRKIGDKLLFSAFSSNIDTDTPSRRAKPLEVSIKTVTLALDEACVESRKERTRSETQQTGHMFLVTARGLGVPKKLHTKYPSCSSKGEIIFPITLPPLHDPTLFVVPAKDKKDIWGSCRFTDPATPDKSSSDSLELVCHHGYPRAFFQSTFEAYSVIGVCDLTVGSGAAAEACLSLKLPYFGICPSESHSLAVVDWLATRMLAMMADQSSKFYDVNFAKHSSTTAVAPGQLPAKVPSPQSVISSCSLALRACKF